MVVGREDATDDTGFELEAEDVDIVVEGSEIAAEGTMGDGVGMVALEVALWLAIL